MDNLKILITDDTSTKVEALKRLLVNDCSIAEKNIDVATNIKDARTLLQGNLYHLLIIDMVLPQMRDSQVLEDEAGADFIEEIYDSPSIIKPIHIIGLTQHEDKYTSLGQRLQDKLWYLIYYQTSSRDWSDKIKQKVFQIQHTIKSIEDSFSKKNKYHIGIICALHDEHSYMKKAFGEDDWDRKTIEDFPLPIYTKTIVSRSNNTYKICAVCANEPGVVPVASLAIAMYTVLKVDIIFMTGYAAGFESDDMKLGDIVIARSVQDYSAGKLVEKTEVDEVSKLEKSFFALLKEVHQMQADRGLITCSTDVIDDDECMHDVSKFVKEKTSIEKVNICAKVAPTVCGPFVVAAGNAMQEIKQPDRKLAALDMEGYGLYYAAHLLQKKALWLKGLSDLGNSDKGDQCHAVCALASGRFLYNLIRNYM